MTYSATIERLRQALQEAGLTIVEQKGKSLFLEKDYTIEVEQEQLFKLLHEGYVVAPFDNIEELCEFIQLDRQLHEEG